MEKVLKKKESSWTKRVFQKISMIWMILLSKQVILISYRDEYEGDKFLGIRAVCKVQGMDYEKAINQTDSFVTNEREIFRQNSKLTLKSAIDMYGSKLKVVEDSSLKSRCYFDKFNLVVFMDSSRYKNYSVLKASRDFDKFTKFCGTINLYYA